jgi:PleD family two-component response regulator
VPQRKAAPTHHAADRKPGRPPHAPHEELQSQRSELRAALDKVQQMAIHDELTQSYNRRHMADLTRRPDAIGAIERADRAMNGAKHEGRNRTVVH